MAKKSLNWDVAPWNDSQMLECAMVVPENDDTASFTFRAPNGAWFDYQPGQFITLDLPVPGGNVQRTYTLSSSPSRPLSITITVKAQSTSIGTRWMLDHLKPGMMIKAYGPSGIFSFHRHPAQKYLMISAGSGIRNGAVRRGVRAVVGQARGRRPMTSDTTKRIRNTKKRIFAIPAAAPAIPPNPRTAAIRATTKKIRA